MIHRVLGIAFLAACGLGSAAQAADLTANEAIVVETVEPAFTWTGFYAGVHAGFGWADLDTPFADSFNGGGKPDGFFGGGQIGYNYQLQNRIVLGIEADASFADLTDDKTLSEPIYDNDILEGTLDFGLHSKLNAFGSVRGRVGYAADRFLPYLTGGLAWARAEQGFSVSATPVNQSTETLLNVSGSKTFTGWTVGAGLEYAVTNNVTAKIEYLYADLGSKDLMLQGLELPADLTMQTVKFGLNYKF